MQSTTRSELRALAAAALEKKAAAQKLSQQRLAANLVETSIKPRVLRAAQEGLYQLEFPVTYSTKEILPELLEAIVVALPDVTLTCRMETEYSTRYTILLDWS